MAKKIALTVTEAKSLWEKGIGLLNKPPTALLLRTRFGIHTLGMKYPIDVVVLSTEHIVVAVKQALQPGNIYVWNPKYHILLELPEHTVKEKNIVRGDYVELTIV